MNFNAGAGPLQVSGGLQPMAPPQMQMTTPSMPAAPAMSSLPAAPAQSAGMGKLQQFVPLLLILIIFLLVGLLVTMVFLLKH
jgi:hypothetical protein